MKSDGTRIILPKSFPTVPNALGDRKLWFRRDRTHPNHRTEGTWSHCEDILAMGPPARQRVKINYNTPAKRARIWTTLDTSFLAPVSLWRLCKQSSQPCSLSRQSSVVHARSLGLFVSQCSADGVRINSFRTFYCRLLIRSLIFYPFSHCCGEFHAQCCILVWPKWTQF